MPNHPRSAYGSNPWAGVNLNGDLGWGGWSWPGGVPGNLLATYPVGVQRNVITTRRELQELVELTVRISEEKHGYQWHNGWCWSYENRPIGGTSSASNHSRGRAIDVNAPKNPYSLTFISEIPPGLIADWCAIGWGWGGYYQGQPTDAMHIELAVNPAEVPACVNRARQILGGAAPAWSILDWIAGVA